eukprot:1141888-Pelagomonas_calceolata.AAC.6
MFVSGIPVNDCHGWWQTYHRHDIFIDYQNTESLDSSSTMLFGAHAIRPTHTAELVYKSCQEQAQGVPLPACAGPQAGAPLLKTSHWTNQTQPVERSIDAPKLPKASPGCPVRTGPASRCTLVENKAL